MTSAHIPESPVTSSGDDGPPQPPPALQHYMTWYDEAGYHARLRRLLPQEALDSGCAQQLDADTASDLRQKAINNQARVWLWETAEEDQP